MYRKGRRVRAGSRTPTVVRDVEAEEEKEPRQSLVVTWGDAVHSKQRLLWVRIIIEERQCDRGRKQGDGQVGGGGMKTTNRHRQYGRKKKEVVVKWERQTEQRCVEENSHKRHGTLPTNAGRETRDNPPPRAWSTDK